MNKLFLDFFDDLGWNDLSVMKSNPTKSINLTELEESFIFARELEKEIDIILSCPEYVKNLLTSINVQNKIISQIQETLTVINTDRVFDYVRYAIDSMGKPSHTSYELAKKAKYEGEYTYNVTYGLPHENPCGGVSIVSIDREIKTSCDCGAGVTSFKDKHYNWCSIKSKE